MDYQKVLDTTFYCRDLGTEITIRDYLKELLCALIVEEESFSGKRPLGNSGWKHDFLVPLIQSRAISGKVIYYNEDGEEDYYEAEDYDWAEVDRVLTDLIVEGL